MNTTIFYLLNEEGRRKSLLAGGDGKVLQKIESDNRQALEIAIVNTKGKATLCVGFSHFDRDGNPEGNIFLSKEIGTGCYDIPKWAESRGMHYFSEIQNQEELLDFETARRFQYDHFEEMHQAEFDEKYSAWEKMRAEVEAQEEKEEEEREQEREKERAEAEVEKAAKELGRLDWINKNGSDYLKMAVGLGYNCQRRYVEERSEIELEDFAVDFDDEIKYRSRSCPGYEALIETKNLIEKGFDAKIIWLTKGTKADDDYGDFEECEAILIENYLEKYDCVKLV